MTMESMLAAVGSIARDHCNVLEECLKRLDEKHGDNEMDLSDWDRLEGEMKMFHSKNAIRIHELLRKMNLYRWCENYKYEAEDCVRYLMSIGCNECPRKKDSLKQLLYYVSAFKR